MIMQKKLLIVGSVLLLGSPVLAQKIDTTWHCPKETTANKMDVGDMPDHVFMLAQGQCSATTSSKGIEEKSAAYTEFRDMKKTGLSNHGRFIGSVDHRHQVLRPARQRGHLGDRIVHVVVLEAQRPAHDGVMACMS